MDKFRKIGPSQTGYPIHLLSDSCMSGGKKLLSNTNFFILLVCVKCCTRLSYISYGSQKAFFKLSDTYWKVIRQTLKFSESLISVVYVGQLNPQLVSAQFPGVCWVVCGGGMSHLVIVDFSLTSSTLWVLGGKLCSLKSYYLLILMWALLQALSSHHCQHSQRDSLNSFHFPISTSIFPSPFILPWHIFHFVVSLIAVCPTWESQIEPHS